MTNGLRVASAGARCPLCGAPTPMSGLRLGGYALHECSSCRFAFSPDALDGALDYDQLYSDHGYGDLQARREASDLPENLSRHLTYRPFFQHVEHAPGLSLLDVGCGVGRFCLAAQQQGMNVVGLEVSAKAAEVARQAGCRSVVTGAVEDLVDQEEEFDVITAFEVIEHLDDPLGWLCRVQTLLQPGGTLFVTTPNWSCRSVREDLHPHMTPPIHKTFFTQWSLRTALVRAGYEPRRDGLIRKPLAPKGAAQKLRWLARVALRGRQPVGLWALAAKTQSG